MRLKTFERSNYLSGLMINNEKYRSETTYIHRSFFLYTSDSILRWLVPQQSCQIFRPPMYFFLYDENYKRFRSYLCIFFKVLVSFSSTLMWFPTFLKFSKLRIPVMVKFSIHYSLFQHFFHLIWVSPISSCRLYFSQPCILFGFSIPTLLHLRKYLLVCY